MSETYYSKEQKGATEVRKRNFDRCPNCQTHSDTILTDVKLWECENDNCRVRYFNHE